MVQQGRLNATKRRQGVSLRASAVALGVPAQKPTRSREFGDLTLLFISTEAPVPKWREHRIIAGKIT